MVSSGSIHRKETRINRLLTGPLFLVKECFRQSFETVSKGGRSVKIKAGDGFNRRHTYGMSRVEI
jgi:hypothetical protein